MPDIGGYPTNDELHDILDCGEISPEEFVEIINGIWWHDGFHVKTGRDLLNNPVKKLFLSTWGWSGNEEVIIEMQKTMFWMLYWQHTERGGHYRFEVPIKSWSEPNALLGKILDSEIPDREKVEKT